MGLNSFPETNNLVEDVSTGFKYWLFYTTLVCVIGLFSPYTTPLSNLKLMVVLFTGWVGICVVVRSIQKVFEYIL